MFGRQFLLAFIACCNIVSAKTDSTFFKFILLPQNHFIPVLTADTRAHQLGATYNGSNNKHQIIGSLGGIFPLVTIKTKLISLQLSTAGTLYTTLLRKLNSGSVVNADYYADVYCDIHLTRNFKMRTGFGHTSHHLSDDALQSGLSPKANNYVKDYFTAGLVYSNLKSIVYAMLYYNHNFKTTDFDKANNYSGNTMWQFGSENNIFSISKSANLYLAGDLKLRQELGFGSTYNIQTGIKLYNNTTRCIRLAVNYTGGYEERGQFYKNKRNFFHTGLLFQF